MNKAPEDILSEEAYIDIYKRNIITVRIRSLPFYKADAAPKIMIIKDMKYTASTLIPMLRRTELSLKRSFTSIMREYAP